METTRLSTKGQIILPKAIREARSWAAGTEFCIEETAQGVLLRPLRRAMPSTLAEVAGCLKWHGTPKTIAQMRAGIARKIKSRHDSGRY
jgi:AbrB family looped-hinge helix DNA binding protein